MLSYKFRRFKLCTSKCRRANASAYAHFRQFFHVYHVTSYVNFLNYKDLLGEVLLFFFQMMDTLSRCSTDVTGAWDA